MIATCKQPKIFLYATKEGLNMEKKKFYLMGDIHGSFKPVRDLYNRHPYKFQKEQPYLVLLGDAGLNYFLGKDENDRDAQTKKKLGKYPFTYIVLRGNHEERPSNCMYDNLDKWEFRFEKNLEGWIYVEKEYPYIWYLADQMAVYYFNDRCVMTLPGAFSVDKQFRLQMGYSWFPHEQMSEDEMEDARGDIDIWCSEEGGKAQFDLILSHTCPIMFEPTDLFLPMVDQSMVDKSMERFLGEVEYRTDYKAWCWGHYHQFREYPITEDGSRRLMLYNDYAVELEDLFDTSKMVERW